MAVVPMQLRGDARWALERKWLGRIGLVVVALLIGTLLGFAT